MAENEQEYKEWDEIFAQREEYQKENPELKKIKRPKTFKDEEDNTRCTKCGSTEDIGNCPDCVGEKEFLKQ